MLHELCRSRRRTCTCTERTGVAGVRRNAECPCGSGQKLKHCCLEKQQHGEAAKSAADPRMVEPSERQLRQFVAYSRQVYDLRDQLEQLTDSRDNPDIDTYVVAAAVLFCGLLRIRSFNALEPKLGEKTFANLIGRSLNDKDRAKLCSADTLGRVLRVMGLEGLRSFAAHVLNQAERNKVFREGWVGSLRFVALDGWEPICSYHRHCDACLIRHIKLKHQDGSEEVVEQYYHRYVVAMLIDERFDMALDF